MTPHPPLNQHNKASSFYLMAAMLLLAASAVPLFYGGYLVYHAVTIHARIPGIQGTEQTIAWVIGHKSAMVSVLHLIPRIQVIPFAAVFTAIWAVFLLLPLTKYLTRVQALWVGVLCGIVTFLAAELYLERTFLSLYHIDLPGAEINWESDCILGFYNTIPTRIRVHYYIFSIILVVLATLFLYSMGRRWLQPSEKHASPKRLVHLGGFTALYAAACIFGGNLLYRSFSLETPLALAWQAPLSRTLETCLCILLAATAVGTYIRTGYSQRHVRHTATVSSIGVVLAMCYILHAVIPWSSLQTGPLLSTPILYFYDVNLYDTLQASTKIPALLRPCLYFSVLDVLLALAAAMITYVLPVYNSSKQYPACSDT